MHELSLAEGAVHLIEEAAEREGFSRVLVVHLAIGALSGVEVDALRLAFAAASRHTCVAGAALDITVVPGAGRCRRCAQEGPLASLLELCHRCEGPIMAVDGHRMRVTDVEVQ